MCSSIDGYLFPYCGYCEWCCKGHGSAMISLCWPIFIFYRYILRNETSGHMVVLFLIFLKNFYSFFHSSCTNLHSHQKCTKVPFSSYHHHLLSLVIFITVILMGVRWYLLVVLSSTFPMVSDVQHLCTYLLALVYLLWKNIYSIPLPIFKLNCLSFCYSVVWVLNIFLAINPLLDIWFANIFFLFSFDVVSDVYFAFVAFAFGVKFILNHLTVIKPMSRSYSYFLTGVLWFQVLHLSQYLYPSIQLSFVYDVR